MLCYCGLRYNACAFSSSLCNSDSEIRGFSNQILGFTLRGMLPLAIDNLTDDTIAFDGFGYDIR
mgnify:CR=1 FL=1